jgi:hypothetical protein
MRQALSNILKAGCLGYHPQKVCVLIHVPQNVVFADNRPRRGKGSREKGSALDTPKPGSFW